MPVAYIIVKERDKALPLCASLTPQVEPFKEEGIFLGLDSFGAARLADLKLYRQGKYAMASSKLIARAACIVLGIDGEAVRLQRDEEAAFLAPLPVDFLWPLEEQVIKHLKILGLQKIGEAASIPREELCLQFGDEDGNTIYNYSRAVDKRPVLPLYPPGSLQLKKTIGCVYNKEALRIILSEIIADISKELSSRSQALQSLNIELAEENGDTSIINRSFMKPVSLFSPGLIESLTAKIAVSSPVTEVRVVAGNLSPTQFIQGVLWEDKIFLDKSTSDVHRLVASVQKSMPNQRICFASELGVSRREKILSLWDPFRFTDTLIK